MFRPDKIFITNEAAEYPLTKSILERLKDTEAVYVDTINEAADIIHFGIDAISDGKKHLLLVKNKGHFIKGCPGTAHPYICCGYRIANFYLNCNLDCTYCILQAYLNNPFIVININVDDMANELDELLSKNSEQHFRIGTGELGDSLSLDDLTLFTKVINPIITSHRNLTFEYKTKSVNIENLKEIDHKGRIIISWSLNSEKIAKNEEAGSASIDERLAAARRCEKWGYKIGFHFDPIIHYEGWQEEYKSTIDKIFSFVSDKNISWISMGCLRFMPQLKEIMEQRFPSSRIPYNEFIIGLDKKMRYFKQLRIGLYSALLEHIRKHSKDVFVYLCMESKEVWERTFGFSPSNMKELSNWLNKQCFVEND